jgi:hypothetical protein
MVFPAVVLLLVLEARRREAIAWGVAGAVVIALYFVGATAHSGQEGALSMLMQPLRLISLGLTTIGAVGDTTTVSLAIGGAIVATWVGIGATGAWRRVPSFVIAAMLFVALSCAMIAAGRAAFGADAVTLPRYRVYSAFALLLTLAAIAALMSKRQVRWILGAACAGAAALYLVARVSMIEHVVHVAMLLKADRDHYAAYGHSHYLGFPPRDFGDYTLERARALGAYDGARSASPPTRIVGADLPAGKSSGHSHAQVYRDDGIVSIAGWIERGPSPPRLWIASDDRAFFAPLSIVRYRGGTWTGVRDAFHGTVRLDGLPHGSYRVGYGGDSVRWTGEKIEIR